MTYIFEIRDISQRKIHLTKERWAHIQKHPEMANCVEHIKEVLLKPTMITEGYDVNVKFYYRYEKEEKQYLFVSVKYLNGEGFVITSFYTDSIK